MAEPLMSTVVQDPSRFPIITQVKQTVVAVAQLVNAGSILLEQEAKAVQVAQVAREPSTSSVNSGILILWSLGAEMPEAMV